MNEAIEEAEKRNRKEMKAVLFSEDGSFTQQFKELFRKKRLELGMTFESTAELFQQNWSTVRKWEIGITRQAAPYIRGKLIDFIMGNLDDEAKEMARRRWRRESGGELAGQLEACLKRASSALKMCEEYPQLCHEMMNVMDEAAQYTLEKLVFEKNEKNSDAAEKQIDR